MAFVRQWTLVFERFLLSYSESLSMRLIILAILCIHLNESVAQFYGLVGTKPGAGQESYFFAIEDQFEEFDTLCTWDSIYGSGFENTFDRINNRYFRRTNKGIVVVDASNGEIIKTIQLNQELYGMQYDHNTNRIYGTYEDWGWEVFAYLNIDSGTLNPVDTILFLNLFGGFSSALDDHDGIWYRSKHNRLYGLDIQTGQIVINRLMPGTIVGLEFDPSSGLLYFATVHGHFMILRGFNHSTSGLVYRDSIPGFFSSFHTNSAFDYIQNRYIIRSNFGIMLIDLNTSTVIDTLKVTPSFRDFEFTPQCPSKCQPKKIVLCAGDSVEIAGQWKKENGFYPDSVLAKYGCYSHQTTQVLVHEVEIQVADSSSVFTATGAGRFQWVNCKNWTMDAGDTNRTFAPSEPGWYAVIVTDEYCVDTSACLPFNVSGIQKSAHTSIQVYPNPVKDKLLIVMPNADAGRLEIRNIQGSLLNERMVNSREIQVDFSQHEKGVYLIKYDGSRAHWTKRIVKTD